MGMFLAVTVMISQFFTVTGQDRRLFLFATLLLWTLIASVAMILMLRHDCYHYFVVMVFLLLWIIASIAVLRADQQLRNRSRNGNDQDGDRNHVPNGN